MLEEPLGKAKPFDIPKRIVWEAYQRVKANRGAAGVDDQSIEAFDRGVKNNLFTLWNRLSSGSYFPSPVKRFAIKKRQGGSRPLGIPTVSMTSPVTAERFTLISKVSNNRASFRFAPLRSALLRSARPRCAPLRSAPKRVTPGSFTPN
jgi:retron-type reverse transcriptase